MGAISQSKDSSKIKTHRDLLRLAKAKNQRMSTNTKRGYRATLLQREFCKRLNHEYRTVSDTEEWLNQSLFWSASQPRPESTKQACKISTRSSSVHDEVHTSHEDVGHGTHPTKPT